MVHKEVSKVTLIRNRRVFGDRTVHIRLVNAYEAPVRMDTFGHLNDSFDMFFSLSVFDVNLITKKVSNQTALTISSTIV